jgi:hypothetical protein
MTGRTPARRLKIAGLLTMTALFSAASVYMIGVTLSPHVASRLARAAHTLAFVRPNDSRSMLFAYGTRLAAGASPLLFCLFALTLARRVVRSAMAFPVAVSAWVAYLAWFTGLRQPLIASSLPIRPAVWAPDVAIVVAMLILAFAYRDRNVPEAFAQ